MSISIDKYYPTNFIRTFSTGANQPILTRALSTDGTKDDIVIKLLSGERMNGAAALKELVAANLAITLGLNAPQPVLAKINNLFIDSQMGTPQYERIRNSEGLNFASKNIVGLTQVGPFDILDINLYSEALKVFYFDLLIQNPDRNAVNGRPNLFSTGTDLWVLDHELAFSFLVPIIGRRPTAAWEFNDSDRNMIEHHMLFNKLRGKTLDFSILNGFLDPINDTFWVDLGKIIPKEWLSSDLENIMDHITAIRNNQTLFVNQIQTFLT